MEEKSIRLYDADKKFFSKLTNTITRLLIPTKVGINGMMISVKRNNVLKAYENLMNYKEDIQEKKEGLSKKYEDVFALYLESIDKYIMDSIYKKVKNKAASNFEENALANYYTITHLKETQYVEYKYRKQKYLLELDYETVSHMKKEKLVRRYKEFYVSKMDLLYKGILKNYSVQLADNLSSKFESKDTIYEKIFDTLEEYITEILPIKMQQDETDRYKDILEDYDEFTKFLAGKLDRRDNIEKRMLLLGISRKLFTHSLPLVVAEQCYTKLLKDVRHLIISSKNEKKKQKAYEMLITLIEDYNIKLLSTKIYWDKPARREEYKKFWDSYKAIEKLKQKDQEEYQKEKEILFIKSDLKILNLNAVKHKHIIKFYKEKLVEFGVMKQFKNKCKTQKGRYKKVNCEKTVAAS